VATEGHAPTRGDATRALWLLGQGECPECRHDLDAKTCPECGRTYTIVGGDA